MRSIKDSAEAKVYQGNLGAPGKSCTKIWPYSAVKILLHKQNVFRELVCAEILHHFICNE